MGGGVFSCVVWATRVEVYVCRATPPPPMKEGLKYKGIIFNHQFVKNPAFLGLNLKNDVFEPCS